MYRWLSLLVLVFSLTGVSADEHIPDVTNGTAIDQALEEEDAVEESVDMTIIIAATILGLCILGAAIILKK
ncbi:MAG: hypothetical protein CXT75_07240 [Methanobacteriota archaeon]|jgi:hypothetical protein|uniref:Uncharacterized protein n=1 Tax=Marine Group III euryarchaeote TaxID=2173149 RepID=A0A7J4GQX9_9ARCH|nr:MAG: hypothetical protein CXT75_07240 [Euryarchaeota archaeon]HIF37026.1 hypothetical protein [Marine Group III euryarchaeote]